jgi:hypothetical protein
MTAPRQPKQMDAGPLLPEIRSFRLHLAAEGKSGLALTLWSKRVVIVQPHLSE